MHFGELDDDRKGSTAPHITFSPQLGGHRLCGIAICTFHLGFSLGKRIGSADQGTDEEPSELRYKDVLDDARVFNHLQESPTSQCPGPDHHPPAAPARTPEGLAPRQRGSTRPGKDKPGWRRRKLPGKVPSASECRFCPSGREYYPKRVEPV